MHKYALLWYPFTLYTSKLNHGKKISDKLEVLLEMHPGTFETKNSPIPQTPNPKEKK
jgi:hypothetical protein